MWFLLPCPLLVSGNVADESHLASSYDEDRAQRKQKRGLLTLLSGPEKRCRDAGHSAISTTLTSVRSSGDGKSTPQTN